MPDWMIPLAINVMINLARDKQNRGKWRKALLKVFSEIAIAFRDDVAFQAVVEAKQDRPM